MPEITIERAMEIALQHHQAGQLADAEKLYRLVLGAKGDHADALHMLGILLARTGRAESAVELLRRAVTVNPAVPEFHSDLGSALGQLAQHEEAADCFRRAISLKPADATFHFNLGTALGNRRRHGEAIAAYLQAVHLNPNYANAYCNLGLAYEELGQLDDALAALRRAVEIDPTSPFALNNLGIVLADKEQFDEAITVYRRALNVKPDHASAHVNLGHALAEVGRVEEAIACYQQALRIKPAFPQAFINFGNALRRQRRFNDALAAYQQALALEPDNASALNNLGVALREAGRVDEAIVAYRKAIALKGDYVEAHYNLGNALSDKGLFDEPRAALQQALKLDPKSAEAHWSMGLLLLLHGHFEAGWREHQWRWRSKQFITTRHNLFQCPWDGSDPRGKTILLYHEQGFGDTIQFVRYARLIAEKGGQVIVHCPEPLARLLRGATGVSAVTSDALPHFDLHCSMMTLPLLMKTQLQSIPADIPYLTIDATLLRNWNEKLRPTDRRPRVGLVWAGQPIHREDRRRSISLAQIAPLISGAKAAFYSLQKGDASEHIHQRPPGLEMIDLAPALHDFADTGACISNLDLVITVDTAVAHLAGALGKPVWVLLPFKPDWRWMLGRDDSPWYPTVCLFRQKNPGDWAEVIEKVAGAFQQWLRTL